MSLRNFFIGIWIVLIGSGVFFLTNSYIKELELIYNSAKLEILEQSFAFHPRPGNLAMMGDERIVYIYLVNPDGTLADSLVRDGELALGDVVFPWDELRFQRRTVGTREVLQLDKLLRRGQEDAQQGLIIGMDYDEYRHHEFRALVKYIFLLLALMSVSTLSLVTWRKWMAAQAEMVENERFVYTGKLSRQIAHEIKNPLGVMQATVDYLRELDDPEMMKAELGDISSEIQRLNRLVERIRSFSRTEEPTLERVEIGAFLQEFAERVGHRYPGFQSSFARDTGLEVLADRDQLTQVLLNLVQNADESYRPEVPEAERKIILGMHWSRRAVEIFVQDWGEPIAEEVQGRLFDAFVTSKIQGSGLGLAISRQIAKAHGGELAVSVDDDAKRFTLVLPRG